MVQVDITEGSSIGNQLMATRIPAIYHVKDGVFSKYDGKHLFHFSDQHSTYNVDNDLKKAAGVLFLMKKQFY